MNNAGSEPIDGEIVSFDVSDDVLEAAGVAIMSGVAYTLFASCTMDICPNDNPADLSRLVRTVGKQ
jgi:hypothetical protein